MLIGKTATYRDMKVTIVSDFLALPDGVNVMVMDNCGQLHRAHYIEVIVDLPNTNKEWVPDWDTLCGNWLAMDANGAWYTFESKPYFNVHSEVWRTWENANDCVGPMHNADITYRHPYPSQSLHQRPV